MKKLEKLKAHALEKQIEILTQQLYALEMGDDLLFSNGNGNKPHYDFLVKERERLKNEQKKLNDYRC